MKCLFQVKSRFSSPLLIIYVLGTVTGHGRTRLKGFLHVNIRQGFLFTSLYPMAR